VNLEPISSHIADGFGLICTHYAHRRGANAIAKFGVSGVAFGKIRYRLGRSGLGTYVGCVVVGE
jgi:hypothetical protein